MGKRDEELYALAKGLVEEMGYALVDVEDVVERGRRIFRFYIDHPQGVMVGDCEAVSREVGYLLDAEFDFEAPYVLEVSSPGLEHEIRKEREYAHFVGRRVRLVLRQPGEGPSVIEGTLEGVRSGRVRVRLDHGGERDVPLEGIAGARLRV